jgi:hypothetical protein
VLVYNIETAAGWRGPAPNRKDDAMRRWSLISAVLLTMTIAAGAQEGRRGRGPQGPPHVTGAWSGSWSAYNPARASTPPKEQCAKLTANITQKGDLWEAVFEGDCGRPYKYTIKMEGKQSGNVVMFKGTADLGPKDGGVYDWIGRAVDDEFVGFYTSAGYTGVFSLSRVK